jgi:hypothetical protein
MSHQPNYIRLLPFYEQFEIFPHETPETLRQRLMLRFQRNFTCDLIETSNDRVLPSNEEIIPNREYFMVTSTDLPQASPRR